LVWQWLKAGRELGLMRSTETSKASDVSGKPQGALVELKGTLRSDAPLKGEFSGTECVYYRALVEREVERTRWDSDGRMRSERVFETESENIRFAPCLLEDTSGTIALDFTGAKVEGTQSHQRFERESGATVAAR